MQNREHLKAMADAEDACGSVSVGGMASDMGMLDCDYARRCAEEISPYRESNVPIIARYISESTAALQAEVERLTGEWACMARACGNWREWPGEPKGTGYAERDWNAAARAILERDELRSEVKQLKGRKL